MTPNFFYNIKKNKSDIQYKSSETNRNEIQKVGKLPNGKVKHWKLTEKKNWTQVASERKNKNPNVFIKGRQSTDFCIKLPGLCSNVDNMCARKKEKKTD